MQKEIADVVIAEDLVADVVPTPSGSACQEDSTPVLRRSVRKRSNPAAASPMSSPKKPRKSQVPLPKLPPTLLSLPYCAISRLLLHLDVDSLENLSATCYYFDQLIAGRFLPSIDFPFSVNVLKEVMNTNQIEKKPLLKLTCKKSRDEFKFFQDDDDIDIRTFSFHKLIVTNCGLVPGLTDYMVFSQMSFLSLHKLREVNLLPESVGDYDDISLIGQKVLDSYRSIDSQLLKQISRYSRPI